MLTLRLAVIVPLILPARRISRIRLGEKAERQPVRLRSVRIQGKRRTRKALGLLYLLPMKLRSRNERCRACRERCRAKQTHRTEQHWLPGGNNNRQPADRGGYKPSPSQVRDSAERRWNCDDGSTSTPIPGSPTSYASTKLHFVYLSSKGSG